ncbi:precorrin-6y C5,15-methyltransferase (decarboxylating), CbiE subunit [Solidesulfovibrio carbinoliphilus subsp. oakridgensis]|uniref:Precorrin-6y C5,15-methyltransferase (Decarboxylating), CbiE subunit n=1 Tax=Solidesulfovibrio carbinoliphilus subsp. oakridgensis TaxID=694327 RepID=G7Q8Q4_9BACT|nr:bifunctional cobalt-precorrin-7 (C(5))-methyltransferase/cobalt-precorrin-6B (C(15))-methyltransferase [Solidesulfovibrio carbinoliphilus]EHJ49141.1 precorrin-6y C5,15-methyltransferase (decarboxylating), CbiE subunit [Solidesulfovibrio carbinoliphilus subsp. oakridgensis]
MTENPVAVVGLGLGPPCLGPEAAAAVARADVLVGGARQLAAFPDHPGRRIPIAGPLAALCDAIEEAMAGGLAVAVLADGDPLFFGIGRTLLCRFGLARLVFFPNVTAVGVAASRLGLPWQDLPAVSLHGRNDMTPLYAALVRRGLAAVYTDAVNTPAAVAARLLERGGDAFAMTVLEDLNLPGERLWRLTLPEATTLDFSPLSLLVVERTRPAEVPLTLGMADDALMRLDRVFTKIPVRAVSLAGLAPRPGDVVWDIGAGAGSVALEASLLCPGGPVFAVERDPGRHALLVENIRLTGALTVTAVRGEAPDAVADLPDPDRIFVGGGLSGRPDLLPALCRRLRPGGRLVVNCVLFGSLTTALTILRDHGLSSSLTQMQANTASLLGGDLRLAAENPVFILAAAKEPARA